MRARLTDRSVETLTPRPGERQEVFDTLLPGLCLRVTETGKKSWSVMCRVAGAGENGNRGRLRRLTLGSYPLVDLKTARQRARDALGLADRGIDPGEQKVEVQQQRNQRTFEAVCDRFIELHAKAHTETWRAAERLLNQHAVPAWRGRQIDEITRASVHELLDSIVTDHGASAGREVRKHLTKLFNWAVDRGALVASPIAGMRRPELAYNARDRVLTMDELRRVWDGAGEMGYPFGSMVRLLILTLQRRSEIAESRRAWLLDDLDAFEVPAANYKTDRPQVVPLSAPAKAVIKTLPVWNGGDCLFSTTSGRVPVSGFSKAKARLDKLCGVEGWTLHDLRRSGATHMARLGVPQEHIERVLGHVIEGVAGTYNRYSYMEEKRAALAKWGALWN